MVAYQQADLLTTAEPANNAAPPSNATRYLNDTCVICHAENHIHGAHKHAGEWLHWPAISCQYGFTAPDRPTWGDTFAEPVTMTVLVGGVCAWCRERG